MKKLFYLIVAIAILVMPVSVALAQPGGPWKAVGKKYVYHESSFGTCIMMDTDDGGVQYWWLFNNTYTFIESNQQWLADGNDLIGTSGTKLHTVGKLISSMTLEEAITRGFDAIWSEYYVKYNWME